MFIIVTRQGETRRLEIPDAIERAGTVAAYIAKPPTDAWASAERVTPHWPLTEAPAAPAPTPSAPADAPAASTVDEG